MALQTILTKQCCTFSVGVHKLHAIPKAKCKEFSFGMVSGHTLKGKYYLLGQKREFCVCRLRRVGKCLVMENS
jgi:hypothetical protein